MFDSNDTLDGNFAGGSGPQMNAEDAANLRKAGKWARFVGIFGMVMIGISIFTLLTFGGTFLALAGLGDTGFGGGILFFFAAIFYLAIFAFAFYLIYLQYRFGQSAMQAVDNNDGTELSVSLAALARLYKITGLILAIYLAFIAFWLVLFLVGGAAALFNG